jgi:sulfur carrier protein
MDPAKARWQLHGASDSALRVRVLLNPQGRELELDGVRRVGDLLERLSILPGTVLVIRGDRLLTEDAALAPADELELRSVVSGG